MYTIEEDFQIPCCRLTLFTPQKQILNLMVYTMEEDFGIFVVYTMEGDFRISWCTPWKLKMVFVVYTMEEDFQIPWCRLTLFTPQKQILNLMVYTMEAENGFRGVHHGRGFWHFRGVRKPTKQLEWV